MENAKILLASRIGNSSNQVGRNLMDHPYFMTWALAGTSRTGSVVNDRQRSWDHDNLYVAGCGSMPTVGTGNPTLTAAALSYRSARDMIDRLK